MKVKFEMTAISDRCGGKRHSTVIKFSIFAL